MKDIDLLLLSGDGVGPEIMESAISLLEKIQSNFKINFNLIEGLIGGASIDACLLYTSPSPRDDVISRMPSSA